jgi:hypothetical protein
VPAGGAALQVLRKKSATDFDVEWQADRVPAGGTTLQALRKKSGADYDVEWQTDRQQVWVPGFGGNGGAIAVSPTETDLSGAYLDFLTGPYNMAARIDFALRLDQTVAAWTWCYVKLRCTPAPVDRLMRPVAGSAAVALMGLHSQGNAWFAARGFDVFWLAPSTSYRFQFSATTSASGIVFPAGVENYILGEFWRR